MLLPFETSFSAWFAGTPQFDWEPAAPPPADPAADPSALADAQVAPGSSAPPPMRLVFKGVAWTVQHVCWSQANPAWEVCTRNDRHEDQERGDERAREARKPTSPSQDLDKR